MKRYLKPVAGAAALGLVAAMPLLFMLIFVKYLPLVENISPVFFIALCPPWEILWAGIGDANDTALWLRLGGMVALCNALLYAPLGVIYVLASRWSAQRRWLVLTVAYVMLLALGHLFFTMLA
ncbi:MAG: hypothetical protein V4857_18630 [Pseudomonadota bacterium]